MRRTRAVACLLAVALTGCAGSAADSSRTLTVLVATSLQQAATTIAHAYMQAHPSVRVRLSFGGSDTLVAQVRGGAPADVLVTADSRTMGVAADAGLLAGPARPIATDTLVIAVAPGNPHHVHGLTDLSSPDLRVALCAPSVPCGALARAVLHAAGRTVHPATLTNNVGVALGLVRTGEVDAALVYRTDVRGDRQVAAVPVPTYGVPPNTDEAAVLRGSSHRTDAGDLVGYLTAPAASAVLARYGFGPG